MAKTNKGRKFFATTASAALVASAIVPVASAAQVNDFNSIASYAQEAVQDLVDRGVVTGDTNGNFQPRKSVSRAEAATILTGALGLDTSAQVNFTDVKAGAWYYDAINAAVNNGVFSGKGEGKFDPNGNLTRGEAAVILVNAFGLTGSAPLAQFADEKSVKAWAVEALEIAVGNGVILGDNGKIKANDAITKQDFAVMFSRAEAASDLVSASTVKAINATTVEVTFDNAIEDIKALDFAIEGLEVKNAVVKQTASNTAVLTTEAQEGGKEYTVTVNGESVGKFTGIAAVIPTAIKVTQDSKSIQGVVGQQVTLKAEVTVAEGQSKAGIPVTFNVDAPVGSLNKDYVYEVTTDENGVATYTYTQYAAGIDTVAVYPTGAAAVRDFSTVYWGVKPILTIEEVTTGNVLANGVKKTYKVKFQNPATGQAVANARVNVSFLENINVAYSAISKATVTNPATGITVTPYQTLNNAQEAIQVTTDSNGEATFIVSGTNTAVSPIVFIDEDDIANIPVVGNDNGRYDATELQATAAKTTFQGAQLENKITVERAGEEEAAAGIENGRVYDVTVVDKDGKPYAYGTVNVGLDEVLDRVITTNSNAYFVKENANGTFTNLGQKIQITLDKDGKGKVTLAGAELASGTPIVWIDQNNSINTQSGVLEEGEPFAKGLPTHFQRERLIGSIFELEEDTKDASITDGTANYTFALSNQSGKALDYLVGKMTYEIVNTNGSDITVTLPAGVTFRDQENRPVSGSTVINGYGSLTLTANLTSVSQGTLSVTSGAATGVPAGVKVTPTFVTANNFNASGIAVDNRDVNKAVFAASLTATFGAADGIPSFAPNTVVEWANLTKDTFKLTGHEGTVSYAAAGAKFQVADYILAAGPGAYLPVPTTTPTYTEVSKADFERFFSEKDVVTFTKGAEGAHLIRLEQDVAGKTDGTVTPGAPANSAPTAKTVAAQSVAEGATLTFTASDLADDVDILNGNLDSLEILTAYTAGATTATATVAADKLSFTLTGVATGTTTVSAVVADQAGETVIVTFTLAVTAPDTTSPTIADVKADVLANGNVKVTVKSTEDLYYATAGSPNTVVGPLVLGANPSAPYASAFAFGTGGVLTAELVDSKTFEILLDGNVVNYTDQNLVFTMPTVLLTDAAGNEFESLAAGGTITYKVKLDINGNAVITP